MDKIIYKDKNNFTASVTKSIDAKDDVFIPFSIHFEDHDYIITSIGKSAFDSNDKIISVSFPENSEIKTIEFKAFHSSSIVSIKIPASLTVINEKAFFSSHHESNEISSNSNIEIIYQSEFGSTLIKKFIYTSKIERTPRRRFFQL